MERGMIHLVQRFTGSFLYLATKVLTVSGVRPADTNEDFARLRLLYFHTALIIGSSYSKAQPIPHAKPSAERHCLGPPEGSPDVAWRGVASLQW